VGREFLRWNTCVRQLAIGFEATAPEEFEMYQGVEAYGFFLEVICGLHSPLLGETEVMGQFKDLIENVKNSEPANKTQLLGFFRAVLTDAKFVRTSFLREMGSRSYGSLIRKYLNEGEKVSVIGAGKLVGEILPWLKPLREVTVKCRRMEQGQSLKEKFGFLKTEELQTGSISDTLIIAAPISAIEISEILSKSTGINKIIDLRESSSRDPLRTTIPIITLAKLFNEIEKTEKDVDQKVIKARSLIKDLSQKWALKAEHRPFGWEDLCG